MLFNANGHHGLMMTAGGGDHSFPERHYADEIESPGLDTNHWAQSTEQVAPKMDTLEPAFSAFFPQTWMDHASLSFHRSQNHLNLKVPASNSLPTRVHDIYSSPIQETTSSPVHQTELDMLWGQNLTVRSPSDFVWVPQGGAQSQQQVHRPSSLGEDDESDSMWSLNDTLEDYFQPHPQAASWHPHHPGAGHERFRRRSVPRVTKPGGSHSSHSHTQGILHGARGLTGSSATVPPNRSLKRPHTTHSHASQSPATSAVDDEDDSSKQLSKKIAHKLSEKTRRNRLTMAIREIEKLLPPTTTTTGDDGEEKAQQAIQFIPGGNAVSKVEVVEMAIGYIKRLREENKRMSRNIDRAEKEKNREKETEEEKQTETPDGMDVQDDDAEVDGDVNSASVTAPAESS
ncbi:hypothetical protein V8F20_001817 [Naviculisporaceae sp. PSN 640]